MHEILKTPACSLIFLSVLFAFLPVSAHALNVTLVEPSQNQVFNSTNNITFTCNATDDGQILNLTLYHNLNGYFSPNQTQGYGELPYDSNTNFLCRFNGNLACQAAGSGLPVASQNTSFQQGKFSYGLHTNDTDILRYSTSGNFDRNQGTIEFWIKPGSDMTSYSWYIFHAAENGAADDINEMIIYVEAGTLYLRIYDAFGLSYWAENSVASWQIGNWYHVAVAWDLDSNVTDNGDSMTLYVNGSDAEASYNCDNWMGCDPPIPYTSASSSFSLGSDKYNLSQINATIDDFRISNRVRNTSEINQSYQDGIGNYSSVSKSWTFSNISDGSYLWNCLAYDNDSVSNSSSNSTFYVDMSTPPSVNGIFLSPNSMDDIDPGITINVTANVTDPSGVSTVIFQWNQDMGNWSNETMAYNSSGFFENASLTTSIVSDIYYYYRIWANDSKGNSGYSPTQNFMAGWDYTWTRSPATFGTVSGLINSLGGNVGILTINNTGDRTLNFTISDNWPLYYNGSENPNFYVTNHTAVTINITADFADQASENDITITINASHYLHTPSPVSLTTNATINSYSGGPYLSVTIMEYTSMVSQSQTFNLSAKVKNIGNETGEGAWLNWTLPSGWSNTSGNQSQFIGNLSSGSYAWNNLTITVNPSSASPGTFIIYANSSCQQNVTGYDSETVGVSCSNSDGVCGYGCSYVNDNDCGIPTGGSPGETVFVGGGGGEEIKYIMRMEAPSSFDLQRGDKKTLKVKITNDGKKTNLTGISIFVAGYPLTHIRISPPGISSLGYNQTGWFELEFFAPNYTRYGMHNLTLTARGTGSTIATKNLTSVENSGIVTLVVHSVHENETKAVLEEAEKAVQEMLDSGFNVNKAKSLLEKAKAQISNWDYDTSLETSKKVLELKENTFHITGIIKQVEEGIREAESYGIQTPESKKMSELSKSALEREDYAKAEERASSAVSAFMIESQGLEIMRFVYANWHFIILGSVVFVGSAYLGYRKSLKGRIRKRIALMSSEEKAIRKLMEKAQEERYKERTLSDSEYHKLMSEHESELAKIKRKKHRLVSKLIRLEKRTVALVNFRKHEESLRSEIQDLQKKYYEQGSVTKSSYQKTMDELREELAESIRNIDVVMNKRKGQTSFLVLGTLLLSVVFAGAVLAQADEKQAATDAMAKAEGWIKDMEQLGFPASRVNDTLNEARLLFSRGFYKGAESLANDVESLKNRAISIDKKIDGVETSIYQAKSMGIDVSQPQALFDEALAAFRMEDYERAEELLIQTFTRLEELESDYSMKKVAEGKGWEGFLKKIQDNLTLILMIAAALIATGIAGAKARRKRKILGRIKSLERKTEKLNSMMKELQTKYFEKGAISESEYRSLMARYKRRLAGAKRKKLVIEGLLNKKEKPQAKDS